MSDYIDQTVAAFCGKVREHEQAAVDLKKVINQILTVDGRPPMFPDVELQVTATPGLSIRADQFYNKPFASCVRTVLEGRATRQQGAASVDDLYDALLAGGFDFDQKDSAVAKRNLAISLGKNTVTFTKLPNGLWGLKEWYPNTPRVKPRIGTISHKLSDAPTGSTKHTGRVIDQRLSDVSTGSIGDRGGAITSVLGISAPSNVGNLSALRSLAKSTDSALSNLAAEDDDGTDSLLT